jgi:phospholipid/cholesterol/gamma-HCH transport system ATP-binding protein
MFQRGGLFGSISVRANVGLPLREFSDLDDALIDEIAEWKLALTGLPPEAGLKLPGELSGGMLKRAALARALALDPELLFLDEPTSGLDPASSAGVDELILDTHALFGPTMVIVSHDLDLLWQVCDRVAVLGEGRVLAIGSMAELSHHDHPVVQAYFTDRRGAAKGGAARPAAS